MTGDVIRKVADGLFEIPENVLSKAYLVGSRCTSCGCVSYPKRKICPDCLKQGTMQITPLSRKGKLYSFSVNQVAPEGFEAPYIIGKVDLPENIRIFSIITGCEPEADILTIGMDMELVFEVLKKDEKGRDLIGYKFMPAIQASSQKVEKKNG